MQNKILPNEDDDVSVFLNKSLTKKKKKKKEFYLI